MNLPALFPRLPGRLRRACVCLFLGLCCCWTGAGCRSPEGQATSANNSATLPSNLERARVRATTTNFFKISPLQSSGADDQLKQGTELAILQKSRSYPQVRTASGEVGYVSAEDIAPLTDQEIAAEVAVANANNIQAQLEAQRQMSARAAGGDGYTIPPEAGNQERLPEPDARPAGPTVRTQPGVGPTPNPIFEQVGPSAPKPQ